MLIVIHIFSGLMATFSALGVFYLVQRERSSGKAAHLAVAGTTITSASGLGLIVQGSSVARVCTEAVLLIGLTSWAIVYARRAAPEYIRK